MKVQSYHRKNLSTILILLLCAVHSVIGQSGKPNVILILADDMGYGDLAVLNGGLNQTPNLDKLMKESVYFSQAYSGSPVCTPSRAAMLTGRYPHRTGAITLNMERFPELTRVHLSEVTIADIFMQNGYTTGVIGKWHIGDGPAYHPMRRGFQEFEGFKGYDVPDDYFNYKLDINGTYKDFSGEYLTENLTKRAINFVQRHQKDPFFLHLAHYAPHRPLSAPQQLIDEYMSKGFNQNTATVYAMIEVMDKGIGELMGELDRLNIRENTIVIFASDNGPDPLAGERFNHNLKGTKYTVDEGGIHVPMLFNWKGNLQPKSTETVVHFTDVLPTLVEICNLKTSENLQFDGGSIAGILSGMESKIPLPQYRFWQWNRGLPYYSHNAAVREGNWKLVRPAVSRNLVFEESQIKPRLYNLSDDPQELKDLAEAETERFQTMRIKLEQWSREVEFSRLSKQNLR